VGGSAGLAGRVWVWGVGRSGGSGQARRCDAASVWARPPPCCAGAPERGGPAEGGGASAARAPRPTNAPTCATPRGPSSADWTWPRAPPHLGRPACGRPTPGRTSPRAATLLQPLLQSPSLHPHAGFNIAAARVRTRADQVGQRPAAETAAAARSPGSWWPCSAGCWRRLCACTPPRRGRPPARGPGAWHGRAPAGRPPRERARLAGVGARARGRRAHTRHETAAFILLTVCMGGEGVQRKCPARPVTQQQSRHTFSDPSGAARTVPLDKIAAPSSKSRLKQAIWCVCSFRKRPARLGCLDVGRESGGKVRPRAAARKSSGAASLYQAVRPCCQHDGGETGHTLALCWCCGPPPPAGHRGSAAGGSADCLRSPCVPWAHR
jgi:hypothetical protein